MEKNLKKNFIVEGVPKTFLETCFILLNHNHKNQRELFSLFPQKDEKINHLTFDKTIRKSFKFNSNEYFNLCNNLIPTKSILGIIQTTNAIEVTK